MNKRAKGNYYRKKTQDFFTNEGWECQISEKSQKIFTPKGIFNKTSDLFGADLICMNGKEIAFIQVKSNKTDINKGIKELERHPFPPTVKRWVVIWTPRGKEPQIITIL